MTQREKTFWWILSCEVTETNTKRRPTGDMFSLPPSWCCCVSLFSLCRCIRHKKCLHHFLVSFQSVRAVCSFCSETQLFQLFSKHKTWGKWWSRSFEWWWWVKGFIYNKEQIDLNLRCWSEVILVRVMKMRDGFWWRTVTLTLSALWLHKPRRLSGGAEQENALLCNSEFKCIIFLYVRDSTTNLTHFSSTSYINCKLQTTTYHSEAKVKKKNRHPSSQIQ